MSKLKAALMTAGLLVGCADGEGGQQGAEDGDGGETPLEDGGESIEGGGPGIELDGGTAPDGGAPPDAAPQLPDGGDVGPGEEATFPPDMLPGLSEGCVGVRYAKTSDRVYVEGTGAVCSPRDIALVLEKLKTPVPQGRGLFALDPVRGIYYLGSNLFLRNGAKLVVRGIASGGDTNELRLKSLNSAEPSSFVFIRAEHGEVTLEGTRVTSWDDAAGGPDVEHETMGRAFIHARSYLDPDGVTPHESRMDIIRSEVSYLGYYSAEAYGLTWKVIGAHTTATGQSLFELVNVHGDILNSDIHHNYFGVYTYGAYGVNWDGNKVHHNVQYGLDPHDDSDTLTITNNVVHDNGNHGIICSRRCDNLLVANNISSNNVGVGIFLHGYVTDSVVEDNEANDNGNAGVALFDSHRNMIRRNKLLRNQYGVRLSVGASGNTLEENEIGFSTKYAIYFYKGMDLPVEGNGRPKSNRFVRNDIHDGAQALKMSDSDDNVFLQNTIQAFINRQLHVKDGNGNLFDENAFPVVAIDDDLKPIFRVEGALMPSTIRILRQGLMSLSVVGQGTAVVESGEGQIYGSLFPSGMVVGADGARLTVANTSAANLTGEVKPLSFFVTSTAPGATATVRTGAWAQNRAWTVTPDGQAVSFDYRLGELTAGMCYAVRRESATLTTLTADDTGFISFSDTPRPAAMTSYVVSPAECP